MLISEWILSNSHAIRDAFAPLSNTDRGENPLTSDGTGKATGINLNKLGERFKKALNSIDKIERVEKSVEQAIKDNPLKNGLPF